MRFSLIVCTYERPKALMCLLESVIEQSLYPDELLIVDSSEGDNTKNLIECLKVKHVKYYKVGKDERGLTKQRNFGVRKTNKNIDVICFLDDDIVLEKDYFKILISTYQKYPNAVGVGGYIKNEIEWFKKSTEPKNNEYELDGWTRKLGYRNYLRKKIGLLSNKMPGVMPEYSNGLSISFLPPSGKIYPVEFFMGGVSSYKRMVFRKISFSDYFYGYGLYEDMDFCLRISKIGELYVNTVAKVLHHHDESGRPNRFEYGKMVIRNGWYVWRVKFPEPKFQAKLKWHAISFVLTLVRFGNFLTGPNRIKAITEASGRVAGWASLLFKKPKDEK